MAIYVLRGSIWYVALFKMTIHLETGPDFLKKNQNKKGKELLQLLFYVNELAANSSVGHCAHLLENEMPFLFYFLTLQLKSKEIPTH